MNAGKDRLFTRRERGVEGWVDTGLDLSLRRDSCLCCFGKDDVGLANYLFSADLRRRFVRYCCAPYPRVRSLAQPEMQFR